MVQHVGLHLNLNVHKKTFTFAACICSAYLPLRQSFGFSNKWLKATFSICCLLFSETICYCREINVFYRFSESLANSKRERLTVAEALDVGKQ